ncbi:response regulator transcription factor [Geopsychrobacter electrodiphilus]|uniref:response regulator transcription factor n=1 Tax=Geopsychrobacter electrodiphilus TaxID=225196 RepID=UPI00037DE479|nr:response regulator transcription factor [Geopsychrobacter electrodiphilus]
MNRPLILVAEDDHSLRQGLIDLLEAENYRVCAAPNGREALELYQRLKPDLLLLDVMMPELSGYDLCREVRRHDSDTLIVMLTAKGEEIDKVVGLELGADDYVTKPFGLHELRARVAAVLRRQRKAPSLVDLSSTFIFGLAKIDRKAFTAEREGRRYKLSSRELTLLETFAAAAGEVLSRNDLLNAAWGVDYFGTTRTLDQHIVQLRKKIEVDPAHPAIIETVHGIGYRYKGQHQTDQISFGSKPE